MADKGVASISASILLDEIKANISGSLNYEPAVAIAPSAGEGWVYAEKSVAYNSNTQILGTTSPASDFIGQQGAAVDADLIMWIAIKNTSTTATDGICISLASGSTPAYNLATGIFIGAGEIVVLKLGNVTGANLIARSVTMDGTYGYPSAANTGTVSAIAAAIVKNVG